MPRASLTPAVVVAGAAELADREGFDAVTVSAVARSFGVQPASLYVHVRDRDALLDGIQRLGLAELGERVADAIAGRAGIDALTGLADATREYARARPGAWAALQRTPTDAAIVVAEARRVADLQLAVLRGYGLAEDELVHATRFIGATVNGFVALERAGAFAGRDEAADASWARAIEALDRALVSWPGTAS